VTGFTYAEMTRRNIGFVTQTEQDRLRGGHVFVCGTGGMGGACLMTLARVGLGRLTIADIDRFEVSNLNRQVFATMDTVGQDKARATAAALRAIDPELELTVLGPEWTDRAEDLIHDADIVVNGTDDLGASLLLYRTARAVGRSVIDAYAAPLPSIYVTAPGDTDHEARLRYPTVGTAWNALTDDQRAIAFLREAEWVVVNSSSRRYLDMDLVGQVVAGTRSRMSFAPMVVTTGQLMAGEAINAVTGRPRGADNRGWFLDPHRGRVEHPRSAAVAALMRPVVRRYLARLAG